MHDVGPPTVAAVEHWKRNKRLTGDSAGATVKVNPNPNPNPNPNANLNPNPNPNQKAYMNEIMTAMQALFAANPLYREALSSFAHGHGGLARGSPNLNDPWRLADFAAQMTSSSPVERQAVLASAVLEERLQLALDLVTPSLIGPQSEPLSKP